MSDFVADQSLTILRTRVVFAFAEVDVVTNCECVGIHVFRSASRGCIVVHANTRQIGSETIAELMRETGIEWLAPGLQIAELRIRERIRRCVMGRLVLSRSSRCIRVGLSGVVTLLALRFHGDL